MPYHHSAPDALTLSHNSALTARARRYLADAVHAFDHAPVEVTLSVLLAAAFSYALTSDAEPFRELFEIGVIIVLTGAVAFTATLLHALGAWSARTRWLVTAGGAGAAALYGMLVLDLRWEGEAWRAATLVAAGVLTLLAAPALAGRAGATERFRRVTGRLLLRTIAVLIYALALFAGLALALGAVNTLFELDLDARIYFHTFGWVFFVLVPWVIVGGLPDYVRPEGDAGPVAAAVHRISAYLVTPLLAIYFIILYAYAVRIALTGELPKNLVSPLVIAAGLIAGVALVLFDRYDSGDTAGSFRWLRMTAPLFVPMSALGVWALSLRWDQYGWTEFRALRLVLLATLGVLAVAAAFGVLRRRSLPTHLLPLTLAIVALLSATGPWSAMAVSRRSQQARLAESMSAAGIGWSATTVRDTLIENEPYREISETTRYLLAHFGPGALPPLFARHAEGTERYVDVVYAAGLRAARPDLVAARGAYGQLASGAALDAGGERLYYVRVDRPADLPRGGRAVAAGTPTTGADSVAGRAEPDSLVVRVPVAGLTLLADLAPVRDGLLNAAPDQGVLPPGLAAVILRDETGGERGELFVIEVGMGGADALHVHHRVGLVRLFDR